MGQPGDQAAADACEAEELPRYFTYLEGVLLASGFLVGRRIGRLAGADMARLNVALAFVIGLAD
jgi:hypothetical protein